MVTGEKFPPDVRIEKEAEVLVGRGHEVFICTPMIGESRESDRQFHMFELGKSRSMRIGIFGGLRHIIKQGKIELVHIQDTPRSFATYLSAKSLGLRVIYDVHEIWPSIVLENSIDASFHDILWSLSLHAEEAMTCFGADATLTVVDEATEYLVNRYHLTHKRFSSIRNFESLQRFVGIRPSPVIIEQDSFKVTYVGGVDGPIRGLEDVIVAASLLANAKVQFLIVGSGRYLPQLQLLAKGLKADDRVQFLGQLSFRDAMAVVAASDLCLVPHTKCVSTEHTLPHKISQYMALRRPVVSTDLRPITRLFPGAFLQWRPRTPKRLAELISSVQEDEGSGIEISRRAYKLVSEKYRWEDEGNRLSEVYEYLSPR